MTCIKSIKSMHQIPPWKQMIIIFLGLRDSRCKNIIAFLNAINFYIQFFIIIIIILLCQLFT